MTAYVSADLRKVVYDRAGRCCEYCRVRECETYLGCQIDHVVSEKHGGPTHIDNLALACAFCNRAKGSDIGAIDPYAGQLVRLFNPRVDEWNAHFLRNGAMIEPLSDVGRATARLLRFNSDERILEREALLAAGVTLA
ncbi:MAG: HNH endonuclease [Pirellulales bacterium]|nr:HNH endonuclease [Pirellulales bacterium]